MSNKQQLKLMWIGKEKGPKLGLWLFLEDQFEEGSR